MCIIVVVGTECTTVTTKRANLAKEPEGIRVYAPKVYLFVDEGKRETTVVYAPDFSRTYDVKPLTVLAKQDFKFEMEDGQLKTLTSNQKAGLLDLFKMAA
jgi:hypothetical protein